MVFSEGKWFLDEFGVRLLGEALLAWSDYREQWNFRADISISLADLNRLPSNDVVINQLTAQDFWFHWYHFQSHKDLIGYVKPNLPAQYDWDQKTPIAYRRAGDALPKVLHAVFLKEVKRLLSNDPDYIPDPQSQDDRQFYLTVCELCGPMRKTEGRRHNDGCKRAARLAMHHLYCDRSLALEEAVRLAMVDYPWIRASEAYQGKVLDGGVVANSKNAAHARVRDELTELIKELNGGAGWTDGEFIVLHPLQ